MKTIGEKTKDSMIHNPNKGLLGIGMMVHPCIQLYQKITISQRVLHTDRSPYSLE